MNQHYYDLFLLGDRDKVSIILNFTVTLLLGYGVPGWGRVADCFSWFLLAGDILKDISYPSIIHPTKCNSNAQHSTPRANEIYVH